MTLLTEIWHLGWTMHERLIGFFLKNDKFSFANFENITTDTLNKLPIERHFASIKVLVSLGTNQDLEVEEIAVTETVAKTAGLHSLDFMCLISNPKEQISRAQFNNCSFLQFPYPSSSLWMRTPVFLGG